MVRIDTSTNEIEARIAVGEGPHTIAAGRGAIWVTNRHSSTLSKINPGTNQVIATVEAVATYRRWGRCRAAIRLCGLSPRGGCHDPDTARGLAHEMDVRSASFYSLGHGRRALGSNGSHAQLYGFDLQALVN